MVTSKVRRNCGVDQITIFEVDEDHNPVYNMTQSDMKVYIIGVGWDKTYVSPRSTRTTYKTYRNNLMDMKGHIRRAARDNDDEIIEWKFIYTHEEKYHVKKIMNAVDIDGS